MSVTISFDQDLKLANDFLALLSREQNHLLASDVEAIEILLEEKSSMLQSMNGAATSRYELLARHGYEASETGMAAWLKKQDKASLNNSWTDLQRVLMQAKEMNRLNGMLISRLFSNNQQLLNHLQGNSHSTGVYGRNGHAAQSAFTRGGSLIA